MNYKIKMYFKLSCFVVLLYGVIMNSAGRAYAADAKMMFEKAMIPAAVSADKSGKTVFENIKKTSDKIEFPASFYVCEKLNIVLFLDTRKNQICKYSMDGKMLGDIKLPFEFTAIDFAYFSESKKLFVIFQKQASIGVCDIDFSADKPQASNKKVFDIKEAIDGAAPFIQKIWPCSISDKNENMFILNTLAQKNKNISFSYRNEKLSSFIKIDGKINPAIGAKSAKEALGIGYNTGEAYLLKQDLVKNTISKFYLSKELVPQNSGYGCRGFNLIGADSRNNIYVEVFFAKRNENIKKAYIYRFNGNARFIGRAEIFPSPETFAGRYITIDEDGGIFYMKKDSALNKLQLYKFIINELN